MASTDPREVARATAALLRRLALRAVRPTELIDLRTQAVIVSSGVNIIREPDAVPEGMKELADVLPNRGHPRRLCLSPGPILLLCAEENENQRIAIEVIDLVLGPSRRVRCEALSYLDGLPEALLTQQSRRALARHREDVTGKDKVRWRRAAVAISDVLREDWLFNLAGVVQWLEAGDDRGLATYLGRVLSPHDALLDSLELGWWQPRKQRAQMEEALLQLVENAEGLRQAMEEYFRQFGHLPLARSLSMSRIVREWECRYGSIDDLWETVWAWAEQACSPLARYHACEIFVEHKERVPVGKLAILYAELRHILKPEVVQDEGSRWTRCWKIRCTLARHFCRHLECTVPWSDREQIAAIAWWLAEQLAAALGTDEGLVQRVDQAIVAPHAQISDRLWRLARPPAEPCDLRYATLFVPNIWSLALQARLSEESVGNWSVEEWQTIAVWLPAQIVGTVLLGFPQPGVESDGAVYGWESGVMQGAQTWAAAEVATDNVEAAQACIDMAHHTTDPEFIAQALGELPEHDASVQMLVSTAFRAMAFAGTAPEEQIWKQVEDAEWRHAVLLKSDSAAIEPLLDALAEIQARVGGSWASRLPHFLAIACEVASGNHERQRLLFGWTLLNSVASDTVSALHRLLQGSCRAKLTEEVDRWRAVLEDAQAAASPGVAARLRAVISSLNAL